jgi:hypothetical protein
MSLNDRMARSRRSGGQPGNRTGTYIVAARDLTDGLALVAAANGFLLLVRGELRLAAEAFAVCLGARPALAGADADKLALELGEATEYRQHQPAVRRGGVGPCVPERAEAGFLLGDRRERVQQVAGRAGEAIEPRHHYHVAGGEFGDKPAQLRPVGLGPARHLAEHLARAGGAELPGLSVNALAAGRDAGIAINRHMGFREGARPALAGGCCGKRVEPRHGVFHATDLRNTQALDVSRSGECCFSLEFWCAGKTGKE